MELTRDKSQPSLPSSDFIFEVVPTQTCRLKKPFSTPSTSASSGCAVNSILINLYLLSKLNKVRGKLGKLDKLHNLQKLQKLQKFEMLAKRPRRTNPE